MGLKHEIIHRKEKTSIDFLGIFTLVPALILLLLALTFGGDKFAWNSLTSFLLFGGFLLLTILFIFVERKAQEPIIDLSLFKNRVFVTTNGLGFLLGLGMFGAIMFVPMFMQGILGVTPTQAGSTMTPMMISLIVASVIGGRLLLRLRYRTVLTIGMVITMIGFYLMSTMGIESKEITAYLYMIVMGLGMGLVMPTLMIAVQNEFPKSKLGAVTSASTFFRSIGGTIGITILNAIMNKTLQTNMSNVTENATNEAAVQILKKVGNETDTLFGLLINPDVLQVPNEIKQSVITSIQTAWSQSFTTVFLTGLIFIGIGVVVALSVGNGKIKRDHELKKNLQKEALGVNNQ
jgi:MFS family permease